MCPQCGGQLQAIVANEDGAAKKVVWCLVCSYTANGGVVAKTKAAIREAKGISIRAMAAGAWNEKAYQRWELFRSMLIADDATGGTLRQTYEMAKYRPGQWVATPPAVTLKQFLRALVGLSWNAHEPQMAILCHADGASVAIGFADKVMSRAQARPSAWEIFRGLLQCNIAVQRVDFV